MFIPTINKKYIVNHYCPIKYFFGFGFDFVELPAVGSSLHSVTLLMTEYVICCYKKTNTISKRISARMNFLKKSCIYHRNLSEM
jgi:hypothetical protein